MLIVQAKKTNDSVRRWQSLLGVKESILRIDQISLKGKALSLRNHAIEYNRNKPLFLIVIIDL
jgi:hypothetical protein